MLPARDTDHPALAAAIDHPSGYLALSQRNALFECRGVPGFIAYREYGRHLFLMGGVHASKDAEATLLEQFDHFADGRGLSVVAVQVRESQADLFRARGYVVNRFGASYALAVDRFSLGGGARMKLRNKIRRAEAHGLSVCELAAAGDPRRFEAIRSISAAWLKAKGKKEIDFMVGELGGPEDLHRRYFVASTPGGPVGFITYVPAWGGRPGYLHDLTRKLPDAPPGTMELTNLRAIETFRKEGVRYLHFGFTPFLLPPGGDPGGHPLVSRIIALLGRYGAFVYPAQSQVQYKLKWGTDLIDPESIAFRGLSLRAVWDLLRMTRSI